MGKYIIKRVLLAVVSIAIVSAIAFFAMNAIPGGPFNKEKASTPAVQAELEKRYNLDKPVPEQYVIYMNKLLHGDWGVSLKTGRDIWTDIWAKFQVSARLGGTAAVIAIIFGIILGSICGPDGVYHKACQDEHAGCAAPGLYPHGEGEGGRRVEGDF